MINVISDVLYLVGSTGAGDPRSTCSLYYTDLTVRHSTVRFRALIIPLVRYGTGRLILPSVRCGTLQRLEKSYAMIRYGSGPHRAVHTGHLTAARTIIRVARTIARCGPVRYSGKSNGTERYGAGMTRNSTVRYVTFRYGTVRTVPYRNTVPYKALEIA